MDFGGKTIYRNDINHTVYSRLFVSVNLGAHRGGNVDPALQMKKFGTLCFSKIALERLRPMQDLDGPKTSVLWALSNLRTLQIFSAHSLF